MALKFTKDDAGFKRPAFIKTTGEVRKETQDQFASQRDEQLKALMLQVKKLSEEAGIKLDPSFVEAVQVRETIMADHQARKAGSVPDEEV